MNKRIFLVTALFLLSIKAQAQKLGDYHPDDTDEIFSAYWLRGFDGWDDGLIKTSAAKSSNVFNKPGFGIHYHESKQFGFWSTGWNPLFLVEGGSGNSYFKGNIGIGTANTYGFKLAVNGNIRAKEIKVEAGPWPDYVFKSNYKLPSLTTVSAYVKQNGHLPGVPSAGEIETKGANLGELVKLQMKKIEELTLYLIQEREISRKQQIGITQLNKLVKAQGNMIYNLGKKLKKSK